MQLLFMKQWMPDGIVRAICWTLLHSLWQGLILAAIAGLLVLSTRKRTAVFRYNALAVLFFAFMGVVTVTFIWELGSADPVNSNPLLKPVPTEQLITGQLSFPEGPALEPARREGYITRFTGYFNQHASLFVTIWFLVFLAKLVKLFSGLVYIQRIKHIKVQTPQPSWTSRMKELAGVLGIKVPVTLLESGLVKVPVVAGFLKPVVLVPIGLMANLPADQVEAILLHELAHIRRRDFLVNLAQSFAEILFFFNPAVLWLSSLLREEREHCCDDMAIAVTQSKSDYIHALVSFQEYQLENAAQYAMAFPGKKNLLLNRVKRIIDNSHKTLNIAEKSFLVLCFSLIGILSVVLAQPDPGKMPDKQKAKQEKIWQANKKEEKAGDEHRDLSKDESRNEARDLSNNMTAAAPASPAAKNADKSDIPFSERFNDPAKVTEGTTLSFDETSDGQPLHISLLKRNNVLYQVDTRYNKVTRFKINGKVVLREGTPLYTSKWKDYQPLITHLLDQYKKPYTSTYQPYQPYQPQSPGIKDTMPVLRKGNSVMTGTITHDREGKQYKITIDNNLATGLSIDGVKVPNDQLLQYRDVINTIFREMQGNADQAYLARLKEADASLQSLVIDNGKNQLLLQNELQPTHQQLETKPVRLSGQSKLQLRDKVELKKPERTVIDDIIDDLLKAGIIKETNPLAFRINQHEFVVNGQQQSIALTRQFHDKYVKKPDDRYLFLRSGNTTTSTVAIDR